MKKEQITEERNNRFNELSDDMLNAVSGGTGELGLNANTQESSGFVFNTQQSATNKLVLNTQQSATNNLVLNSSQEGTGSLLP